MTILTQRRVPAKSESRASAIAELLAGRPVVVWCAGPGRAMGLLVAVGATVTTAAMALLVRHCSGLVCVTVAAEDCVRLHLPAMPLSDEYGPVSEMRVTVDAAEGVGTGISACDRARTTRLLADPATERDAFTRPGHVMPVRVDTVPAQAGPAQQVANLVRPAGLGASGVYSQLVSPDGMDLADHGYTADFAARHELALIEQESL